METKRVDQQHEPWNKGKLVGQKAPFKLKEVWAIRVRLQMYRRQRELALFNLGIDSKLRACDLVSLRVRDVCHGDQVAARTVVMQHKTQRPVQFEIERRHSLRNVRRVGVCRRLTGVQPASVIGDTRTAGLDVLAKSLRGQLWTHTRDPGGGRLVVLSTQRGDTMADVA